jgi:hypothetical protein
MNRKLHNTVMALIASSSLFVLGLLSATPAVPGFAPLPPAAAAAAFDADRAVAAETAADRGDVEAAPRRHPRRTTRQSVAMPFFSFAPRG